MALITIGGLPEKATPVDTDEFELQEVSDGLSFRTSLAGIRTGLLGPGLIRFTPATFTRTLLQAAIDTLAAANGGVVELTAGSFPWDGTPITPKDKVTVRGAGMGATLLLQTVPATRLFHRSGGFTGQLDYVAFEDFTAYGMWESSQSLGGNDDRHFGVDGIKRLRFSNIESVYCRQMAITAGYCDEVYVEGCRVRYCARDGINLTGNRRVIVVGNHLTGISDDAIAIHQNASAGNPPLEGHIIFGNTIEDAYGIKALGMSKGIIAKNVIRRPKGYGMFIRHEATEGYNDAGSLIISTNSITDIINANKFGGGNVCVAILISSAVKSYQDPVVGGATPDINLPENFYYLSNHASNQNAGAQGIIVSNNTVNGFTLPPSSTYSSWGFGQAFLASGFVDPDLSTGFKFSASGVRLGGALLSVAIKNNTFIGLTSPITADSDITALKQLTVRGNDFIRYSGHGVGLETSTVKHGKAIIENNLFDADPYLEHANRTAGPDGTWSTGAQQPTVCDAVNWKGVQVLHNTIRNVNQVMHTDADTLASVGPNVYIMEPHASATLQTPHASNKGIRHHAGLEAAGSLLVWEDSTPTNSTYGQELGRNNLSASAMPTTGYYMAGQFVSNTAFGIANQLLEAGVIDPNPEYTVLGWKRLTTGSAHVLNTDWLEMRCLTGN